MQGGIPNAVTPKGVEHELTGRLANVIWSASDGSAAIANVVDGLGQTHTVKGPTDRSSSLQPGCSYRLLGQWQVHEKYGKQFLFACYTPLADYDRKGVIAYLVAVCDGIGQRRAEALWKAYGPRTIQILRDDPVAVARAGIMPLNVAEEAAKDLFNNGAFEATKVELMGLFAGRGFQVGRLIKACLARWGHRAPELVRRNPYLLLAGRMPGAGWKRCDKLYLDLGLDPARLKRQTLCAVFHLRNEVRGHTWIPVEQVGAAIQAAVSVSAALPVEAIRLGIRAGLLALKKNRVGKWVAESQKANNELAIAVHVRRLREWTRT